jgi:hypothetical protein
MKTLTFTQKLLSVSAIAGLMLASATVRGADITRPGDPIVPTSANSPGGEVSPKAIDNDFNTKYLNFDKLNTGFTVTPSVGSSVVQGISLVSANDAPERNPTSFTLEGSNDGGGTWTPIASGPIPAFTAFFQEKVIMFANAAAYTSYRILFPTVQDPIAANSMQIAEVQLLDGPPNRAVAANFRGRTANCCNPNNPILADELAGAGLNAQKNWNNIDDMAVGENGTSGQLNDRDGNWTPTTLQFAANDSWNSDGPTRTANERLMAGIIKAGQDNGAAHTDTFTLHNVPPGRHNLVLYTPVNGDGVPANFTAGGTTFYITQLHQFNSVGYKQAFNTTDPAAGGTRDTGNFIVFNGLTPDGNGNLVFTMTWPTGAGDGAGLAGVQLVSPEPKVYSIAGAGLDKIRITFNTPVSDAAANAANYSVSGGVTVNSAVLNGNYTQVLLTTTAQTPRANYTVTINGITTRDAFADPISPNTKASFTAISPYNVNINFTGGYDGGPAPQSLDAAEVAGVFPENNWNNVAGNNNNTTYIDGIPLKDGDGIPTPVTIQYGADEQWISGTGTTTPNHKLLQGYHGFANENNIRPVVLRDVPEGHYSVIAYTVRDGSGEPEGFTINNDSSTTLHVKSEGFGDWNANPTFRRGVSTDPNARDLCNYVQFDNVQPVDGTITIDARSESFRSPVNGIQLILTDVIPIQILRQPIATAAGIGSPFSFSVDVIGSGPRTVQWFSNNVAIGGANALIYNGISDAAGNGAQFKVTVSNATSSQTSDSVTLTVAAVPVLLSASSAESLSSVCLRFNKPIGASSAADISHYAINNGVTVSSAALAASDPSIVILQTSPLTAGTTYTVTVTGLTDNEVPANTIFPNPSSTTFTPGGYEVVRLTYEQYRNLNSGNSQSLTVLTTSPKYPNSPDFVEYNGNNAVTPPSPRLMEYPQTAAVPYGNLEDFGARIRGYYVAPADGNYQFAVAADDHAEVWLSTDANPANKVKLASVPDWTNERNYITRSDGAAVNAVSANVPLLAGHIYYLEGLYKEGGGGDHISVAVRRPNDPAIANGQPGIPLDQFAPDPAYAGQLYYVAGKQLFTPGPVTLTAEPADAHVVEGQSVSFVVNFNGTPPTTIEWLDNGTVIPGASGKTLTMIAAIANNGHTFTARVKNACSTATSRAALLTVDIDSVAPTAFASCDDVPGGDDHRLRVTFSEAVLSGGGAAAADNPDNYFIDGGLVITSATLLADGKTVLLTASDVLVADAAYNLSIQNVKDRSVSGNTIDPTNLTVRGCVCANSVVQFEMFRGNSGANNFLTLSNNAKFPNNPDLVTLLPSPNWAQTPNSVFTTGNEENYSGRMRGYVLAPETGNYTFQVHADDSGMFRISTDGTAANLKTILFAPGDCGACGSPNSTPVTLTAGQLYYFESLFQEGGGGDYLEVRWQVPSGGGYQFIPGSNLCVRLDPVKAPVDITGPDDVVVEECKRAVFSVNVSVPAPFSGLFQWYNGDTPIQGANGSTYEIPSAQLTDDGALISVVVTAAGQVRTSRFASLTVLPDVTPPTLVSAVGDDTLHRVTVSFSEPMDPATATDNSLYSICDDNGNCLTIQNTILVVNETNVILTTAEPMLEGSNYVVTIVGGPLYDKCAAANNPENFVAIGSSTSFHAWIFVPCFIRFETYESGTGVLVSDLTSAPTFPNSPRETRYINGLNSRLAYPDDSHDNYGGRISGFFVPPTSGDYQFAIASDDASELFLSTDSDPANKVSLATMPEWTGDRQYIVRDPAGGNERTWTTTVSPMITLTAGNRYYIEALYKEGGGGDHCEVTVRPPGAPPIVNDQAPIGPEYIGMLFNPDKLSTLMPTVPTTGKLPLGSLTDRGFGVKLVRVDEHTIPNTFAVAEQMLAGTYINPATSSPYPNTAPVKHLWEQNIINYNIEVGPFGSIGPDAPFPGLPQVVGPETESLAMEVLTYLELRAGIHCMIVNSDDGFRVTPATSAADPNNSIVLGQFEGGRGSSDTPYAFNVAEDGLYPMRLIWEQGGGGANIEWVDIVSGTRYAVNANDSTKAFAPAGNGCPTATAGSANVDQDGSVALQLAGTDADNDSLTFSVTEAPAHGTVVVQVQTGAATYTPTAGYCGTDSFKFKVSDGRCESAAATISLNVINCNTCPTATSSSLAVAQDTPKNLQLEASDPENNPLTYAITQAPAHGIVTLNVQTGAASYSPSTGYTGPDSFKFKVNDGKCDSGEATVSVTVGGNNEPPVCVARVACGTTFAGDQNTYLISLNGSNACTVLDGLQSSDPEGAALGFRWFIQPNQAPFAGGPVATNCFDLGCHVVTLSVTDAGGATCTTNISLCVISACDAIGKCITLTEDLALTRKNKNSLVTTLKAACIHFNAGEFNPALKELSAFQNKVAAQVGKADPAAAESLIDCAQRILDGIDCAARLALESSQ